MEDTDRLAGDESNGKVPESPATGDTNEIPYGVVPEATSSDVRSQQERDRAHGLVNRLWQNAHIVQKVIRGASRNTTRPSENVELDTNDNQSDGLEDFTREMTKSNDIMVDVARWTRRRDIPLAVLAWCGVAILAFWLAGHVTRTIILLVIAGLLAYALSPLVTLFQRVMPRVLAILFVYLIVLGGFAALLYLVVTTAIVQVNTLAQVINKLLAVPKNGHLSQLDQILQRVGITNTQISQIGNQILGQAENLSGSVLPVLTEVFNVVLDIILIAVLSIYLLIDGGRVTRWLRRNMPRTQRGRINFLLNTLQRVVGGYIRGQLLLCGLIGLLVGVGMWIIGVPYALLLGVLAFILEFIPILGTLVSGLICVLLALTVSWVSALIVLVYFIVVHIIEGDVVGPRVVGQAVGLHPVVSIAALIAGGELFGIWGALFGSPIAGVIQAFLVTIWAEWREMHPQEFQAAKKAAEKQIAQNVADKPMNAGHDSDDSERLLS